MRLIDADRLIEDMGASCLPIMEKGISEITGDESCIVDHINSAPTIDAVPVVRCKDCKLFVPQLRCCCSNGAYTPMPYNPETFFCARGERREEHDSC